MKKHIFQTVIIFWAFFYSSLPTMGQDAYANEQTVLKSDRNINLWDVFTLPSSGDQWGIKADRFGDNGYVQLSVYFLDEDGNKGDIFYQSLIAGETRGFVEQSTPSAIFGKSALDPAKSVQLSSINMRHRILQSMEIYPENLDDTDRCVPTLLPDGSSEPDTRRLILSDGSPIYMNLNSSFLTENCRSYFSAIADFQANRTVRVEVRYYHANLQAVKLPGIGELTPDDLGYNPTEQFTGIPHGNSKLLGWSMNTSLDVPFFETSDRSAIIAIGEVNLHNFWGEGFAEENFELLGGEEAPVFSMPENGLYEHLSLNQHAGDYTFLGYTDTSIPVFSLPRNSVDPAFVNQSSAEGYTINGYSSDGVQVEDPSDGTVILHGEVSGFNDMGLPTVDLAIQVRSILHEKGQIKVQVYPSDHRYSFDWRLNDSGFTMDPDQVIQEANAYTFSDLPAGTYQMTITDLDNGKVYKESYDLDYKDVFWMENFNLTEAPHNHWIKTDETLLGSAVASLRITEGDQGSIAIKFDPAETWLGDFVLRFKNSRGDVISSLRVNQERQVLGYNNFVEINEETVYQGLYQESQYSLDYHIIKNDFRISITDHFITYHHQDEFYDRITREIARESSEMLFMSVELSEGRLPSVMSSLPAIDFDHLRQETVEISEKIRDEIAKEEQFDEWIFPLFQRLESARLANGGVNLLSGFLGSPNEQKSDFDAAQTGLSSIKDMAENWHEQYNQVLEPLAKLVDDIEPIVAKWSHEASEEEISLSEYFIVQQALVEMRPIRQYASDRELKRIELRNAYEPVAVEYVVKAEEAAQGMFHDALEKDGLNSYISEKNTAADDKRFPIIDLPQWAMNLPFSTHGSPREGSQEMTLFTYSPELQLHGAVHPENSVLGVTKDRNQTLDDGAASFSPNTSLELPSVVIGEVATLSFWTEVTDTEDLSHQVLYTFEAEGETPQGLYRNGIYLKSLGQSAENWNNPNIQFNEVGHYQIVVVMVPGQTFVHMYKPKGGGLAEFGHSTTTIDPGRPKLFLGASQKIKELKPDFISVHNMDDFRVYDQALPQATVMALNHHTKGSRIARMDKIYLWMLGEQRTGKIAILEEDQGIIAGAGSHELQEFSDRLKEFHYLDKYLANALNIHLIKAGELNNFQRDAYDDIIIKMDNARSAFGRALINNDLNNADAIHSLTEARRSIKRFVKEDQNIFDTIVGGYEYGDQIITGKIYEVFETGIGILEFDHFDLDKDGYVTKEEANALYDDWTEGHDDIFDRFDHSHDGRLARHEFSGSRAGGQPDRFNINSEGAQHVYLAGDERFYQEFNYAIGGEDQTYGYMEGMTLLTHRKINDNSYYLENSATIGEMPLAKVKREHFGSAMGRYENEDSKSWDILLKLSKSLVGANIVVIGSYSILKVFSNFKKFVRITRIIAKIAGYALIAELTVGEALGVIDLVLMVASVGIMVYDWYINIDTLPGRIMALRSSLIPYEYEHILTLLKKKIGEQFLLISEIVGFMKQSTMETSHVDLNQLVRDIISNHTINYLPPVREDRPSNCEQCIDRIEPSNIVDMVNFPRHINPYADNLGAEIIDVDQNLSRQYHDLLNVIINTKNYSEQAISKVNNAFDLIDLDQHETMESEYNCAMSFKCQMEAESRFQVTLANEISSHISKADLRTLRNRLKKVFDEYQIKIDQSSNMNTFAIIGNNGCNPLADNNPSQSVASRVHSWHPDFIVSLGATEKNSNDGCTNEKDEIEGQFYQDYMKPYAGQYGSGSFDINRYFPIPGANDRNTKGFRDHELRDLDYWKGYYSRSEDYYDFEMGNIHFFVLNTNNKDENVRYSDKAPVDDENSDMAEWLRERLSMSNKDFQIVLGHHSPYLSGEGESEILRWPFKQWGADMVITSGNEFYERHIGEDGLMYVVNGAGGKPIDLSVTQENYASTMIAGTHHTQHGALRASLNNATLKFQFVDVNNNILDQFFVFPQDDGKFEQYTKEWDKNYYQNDKGDLLLGSGEDLDIYLILGQSNAAARCPEGYTDGRCQFDIQDSGELTNAFLLNNENRFEGLINPVNKYSSVGKLPVAQGLSIGYNFAKTIVEKKEHKIGIISNARGGTDIAEWQKNFDHTQVLESGKTYQQIYADGGNNYRNGNLYSEAIARAQEALETYPNATIKGILWHHGENDTRAVNEERINYTDQAKILFNSLREDLNLPNLPVFIGELARPDHEEADPDHGDWTKKKTNDQIDNIPNELADAWIVRTEGLKTYDGIQSHFTYDSYLTLGKRFAYKTLYKVYDMAPEIMIKKNNVVVVQNRKLDGSGTIPKLNLQMGDELEFEIFGISPVNIQIDGLPGVWISRFGGEVQYYCTPSVTPGGYNPFIGFDSQIHGVTLNPYPHDFDKQTKDWVYNPTRDSWSWKWVAQRRMSTDVSNESFESNLINWSKTKDLSQKRPEYWPKWKNTPISHQRNNQKEGINMELLHSWNGVNWDQTTNYQNYASGVDHKKYVLSLDDDEIVYLGSNNYDAEQAQDAPTLLLEKSNYWKLSPDANFWSTVGGNGVLEQMPAINEMVTAYQKHHMPQLPNEYTYSGYEIEDFDQYIIDASTPHTIDIEMDMESMGENNMAPGEVSFNVNGLKKLQLNLNVRPPNQPALGFYREIEGTMWPSVGEKDVPYSLVGLENLDESVLNGFSLQLEYQDEFGYLSTTTRYLRDLSPTKIAEIKNNGKWMEYFDFDGGGYYSITAYYQRCEDCEKVIIGGKELMEIALRFISAPGRDYKSYATEQYPGLDLNEGRGMGAFWFMKDANSGSTFRTPKFGFVKNKFSKTYTITTDSTITFATLDSDPYTFTDLADQWYLSERYQAKRIPDDSLEKYLTWSLVPTDLMANKRGGEYGELANNGHDKVSGKGKFLTHRFTIPGTYELSVTYRKASSRSVLINVVDRGYDSRNAEQKIKAEKGELKVLPLSPDQLSWLNRYKKIEQSVDKLVVVEAKNILSTWQYVDGPRLAKYDYRFSNHNGYYDSLKWYAKDMSPFVNEDFVSSYLEKYERDIFYDHLLPKDWVRHCSPCKEFPDGIGQTSIIESDFDQVTALNDLFSTHSDRPESWQVRLPWTAYTHFEGYRTRANIKVIIDLDDFWDKEVGAFSGVGNSRFKYIYLGKDDQGKDIEPINHVAYRQEMMKYPFPFTEKQKDEDDFFRDLYFGRKVIVDTSKVENRFLTAKSIDPVTKEEYMIAKTEILSQSYLTKLNRQIKDDFILGADISSVSGLLANDQNNVLFKRDQDDDGKDNDGADNFEKKVGNLLDILKEYGGNTVRMHMWVHPKYEIVPRFEDEDKPIEVPIGYIKSADGKAYPFNTLDDSKTMILLAKSKGLKVLLDLMYSDTWANPGKQVVPESWKDNGSEIDFLNFKSQKFKELVDRASGHTLDVLNTLKASDALPDIIQVGNETPTNIMLTEETKKYFNLDAVVDSYCIGKPNCDGLGDDWRLQGNAKVRQKYKNDIWKLLGFSEADVGRELPQDCKNPIYPEKNVASLAVTSLDCINRKEQIMMKHVDNVNWDRNITIWNQILSKISTFNEENSSSIKTIIQHNKIDQLGWWLASATKASGHTRIGTAVLDLDKLDYIGSSFYKTYSSSVKMSDIGTYIEDIFETYKIPVVILETGYPHTLENDDTEPNLVGWVDGKGLQDFKYLCQDEVVKTERESGKGTCKYITPEQQKGWLTSLRDVVYYSNGGAGVLAWEPFWIANSIQALNAYGSTVDNQAFFDKDGVLIKNGGIQMFCLNNSCPEGTKNQSLETALTESFINTEIEGLRGVNFDVDSIRNGLVIGESNMIVNYESLKKLYFTPIHSRSKLNGKTYFKYESSKLKEKNNAIIATEEAAENLTRLNQSITLTKKAQIFKTSDPKKINADLIPKIDFNGLEGNVMTFYEKDKILARFEKKLVLKPTDPKVGLAIEQCIETCETYDNDCKEKCNAVWGWKVDIKDKPISLEHIRVLIDQKYDLTYEYRMGSSEGMFHTYPIEGIYQDFSTDDKLFLKITKSYGAKQQSKTWEVNIFKETNPAINMKLEQEAQQVMSTEFGVNNYFLYEMNADQMTADYLRISGSKLGPFFVSNKKPTIHSPIKSETNSILFRDDDQLREKDNLLSAHRGYYEKYPENSQKAFEEALKIGNDKVKVILEVDAHLTGDSVLVVSHDNLSIRETDYGSETVEVLDVEKYIPYLDTLSVVEEEYWRQFLPNNIDKKAFLKLSKVYWENGLDGEPGLKNAKLRDAGGRIYRDERGDPMNIEKLSEIIEFAKQNDVILVIDKAFDKLAAYEAFHEALKLDWEDNVVFKAPSGWMPDDLELEYGAAFMKQIFMTPYYHRSDWHPGPWAHYNAMKEKVALGEYNIPAYELQFKSLGNLDDKNLIQPQSHAEEQMHLIRNLEKKKVWLGITQVLPTGCGSVYTYPAYDSSPGEKNFSAEYDHRSDMEFSEKLEIDYYITEDLINVLEYLKIKNGW